MKMRRMKCWWAAAFAPLVLAGCGALGDLLDRLLPRQVRVELANRSPDFDVDVDLFYGDDQDTIESVLREFGTEVNRRVGPGETSSFARDCGDLQAIFIDDADLRVLSGVGPEDDTDILRDGTDFRCGDTIRFVFDHSAAILDFAITVEVE